MDKVRLDKSTGKGWFRRLIGRVPTDVRVAVAAIGLVGVLGGWATQIGPWYLALQQPPWKPPDALFGPAWLLIYLLAGWACVRAWRRSPPDRRLTLWTVWFCNGALNIAWSVLFFSMRRPDWALPEAVLLELSILCMMAVMRVVDRRAVILLLPYAVWVGVAALMNRAVVQLNGPFA